MNRKRGNYHKGNYNRRVLVVKKLCELYVQSDDMSKGKEFVCEHYGKPLLGIGYETFLKNSNNPAVDVDFEEMPIHIEALLRSMGPLREKALEYANGKVSLSELNTPEFKSLYDTIVARRKRKTKGGTGR